MIECVTQHTDIILYKLQSFYSLLCTIFTHWKLLVINRVLKYLSWSLIRFTNCLSSGRHHRHPSLLLQQLAVHCRFLTPFSSPFQTPPLPLVYCHAPITPLPRTRTCFAPPFCSQAQLCCHAAFAKPHHRCCHIKIFAQLIVLAYFKWSQQGQSCRCIYFLAERMDQSTQL